MTRYSRASIDRRRKSLFIGSIDPSDAACHRLTGQGGSIAYIRGSGGSDQITRGDPLVRSWHPIPANALDDTALIAEHNELLIIAKAAAGLTRGWRNHPEVLRWRGHSKALKRRHDEVAMEMVQRGFNHRSPWPEELINEADTNDPPKPWQPLEEMARILDERMRRRSGRPLNWVPPKHDEPLASS